MECFSRLNIFMPDLAKMCKVGREKEPYPSMVLVLAAVHVDSTPDYP